MNRRSRSCRAGTVVCDVSVVICTYDRRASLETCLQSIVCNALPNGFAAEVVVADNSPDQRNRWVCAQPMRNNISLRYVHEPRPGKCIAANTAIAALQGRVLLFTDDDTRVPPTWIAAMSRPIIAGRAAVVGGALRIPDERRRPWMLDIHRSILLDGTGLVDLERGLIGANMAVSRHVLEKVPGFDPELGPAGLGAGEDTLFCLQLHAAGYKCELAGSDAVVEHLFEPSRVRHDAFVDFVMKLGHSRAYIAHHWRHERVPFPRLRLLRSLLGLAWVRLRYGRSGKTAEGIHPAEFHQLERVSFYRQMAREQHRPKNYVRHGLTKLAGTIIDSQPQ